MAKRVSKKMAGDLIKFVKSLEVHMNIYNSNSVAAYEFGRQMMSPSLKKTNPSFTCSLKTHNKEDIPLIKAEFIDGSKWEVEVKEQNNAILRGDFFSKADSISETTDNFGDDDAFADDSASKKAGGKGKK